VAFVGRAAVDETHVRRPVRRHDHVGAAGSNAVLITG
jgi:hypothetical protein